MRFDVIIVGGGLQGGLIALAFQHFQPNLRIVLIEKQKVLGGNHTWSFHAQDVPLQAQPLVEPLICARWPGYRVQFPGFARRVESRYYSILSDHFHQIISTTLLDSKQVLLLGTEVKSLQRGSVITEHDSVYEAHLVIDARGVASVSNYEGGFQKFVGWEIEQDVDWPEEEPLLMDATVPQEDGFRFIYTLPFSKKRILIEDTVFSDSPYWNKEEFRNNIRAWLSKRGVQNYRVLREEFGILPMPWSGKPPRIAQSSPIKAGCSGNWYHPATGYSFPLAIRVALALAQGPLAEATQRISALSKQISLRYSFSQFLNYLLFEWIAPGDRWQVFCRLYRALPEHRLARFYALNFNLIDSLRMVVCWPPPISIGQMLKRYLSRNNLNLNTMRQVPCHPPSNPIP